jgi:hypothetical protein
MDVAALAKNLGFSAANSLVDQGGKVRLAGTSDSSAPVDGAPAVDIDKGEGFIAMSSGALPMKKTKDMKVLPNSEFASRAKANFKALSVDDSQAQVAVESLAARSLAAPDESREVEKLVFVDRVVNGVPVLGNRVVLSHHLDGRLRQIVGRWTPINFEKSQFASQIASAQELTAALAEMMVEWKFDPQYVLGEIKMDPVYDLVKDAATGEYVLDMKAEVSFRYGETEATATRYNKLMDL